MFFPVIMENTDATEFQKGINLYMAPHSLKVRLALVTSCIAVQRMTFSVCIDAALRVARLLSATQLSWVKSAVYRRATHTERHDQGGVAS